MSSTENHIVTTYSRLLSGLSASSKRELVFKLQTDLEVAVSKPDRLAAAFGGFGSTEKAETIISDIKAERDFRHKDLNF